MKVEQVRVIVDVSLGSLNGIRTLVAGKRGVDDLVYDTRLGGVRVSLRNGTKMFVPNANIGFLVVGESESEAAGESESGASQAGSQANTVQPGNRALRPAKAVRS